MAQEHKKTTNRRGQCAAPQVPAPEVFFDGACPLCQAEIAHYRKAGARARFRDVSDAGSILPEGCSREAMLARFHVRLADGRLVSGAAAFAELWQATPGWRLAGRILALPPVLWIAEGLYRLFLPIRPGVQRLVRRAQRT
ncbi:DUF393 domain-containing protein [Marinicauda algicola]|uniref:DUF393 domain-containing protein n=1 Tax=Marinicauda algicola TaxID=2029849 RepID=A0A4S2GY47_9PROT|nr:DUF393 domain-containing protein [Marinicauda algicola]